MTSVGSVSIQLKLDRASFDSDLQKLSQQNAPSLRVNLDTKSFEQQIKGLQKLATPILIPLQIDSANFSQQLKKLSASIDPIKVDLAPNVADFQEKLRRLSKISPIEVEIKADGAKVKQQFETIGKYAAEGFAQGFSGAEDAGKSAIDSMVRSVNKQLGIQSPSKVFRQIGEYAIAGLMQGLESVDTRAIVDKITSDFRAIDISAEVKLVADTKGLQQQITGGLVAKVSVEVSGNSTSKLSDSIADAVAHAIKKTQSKSLFGGILDMVAAPFKLASSVVTLPFKALGAGLGHTFEGVFLGAGLPLGESLGAGIAKGVNKYLKGKFNANLSNIGINLTDLSKADWNLAKAIDALFIEGNPIGKARKAVKDLQDVFADLKVLVAPGTIEKVVDFGKLSAAGPREFRKQYIAAAQKAKAEGRELTPEQFTEELKPKAEFKAVGTAIKLAAIPFGFKNKVMSFEAQRQIEARANKIKIPEIIEPTVTLVTGGFQKQKGRGAYEIAELAKSVLPQSHVIPIPNTYTDRKATDTKSELLNFIKSLGMDVPPGLLDTIQNTEKLVGTAAYGYNPDAIRIAAYARAVQRKYPEKPVNAVTFSGGTYPLEQAIQFDTDAGGKAKGIGLGAGLYGLTGRHNPNYRAMIGEQDPLGFPFQLLSPTKNTRIIPNFADVTSMDVHNPKRYFANPSVQGAMSEMFSGFVAPQGTDRTQESIFSLINRKVSATKHSDRLSRFIADPTSVPSKKVDESFGELADFISKNSAFGRDDTPASINKDPKQRTLPELAASGDSLALEAQQFFAQVKEVFTKTSAVLAKPLGIPESMLASYEPEQRAKVIRAVSKVKAETPNLTRTLDRLQGAPDDKNYAFYTRDNTSALKHTEDFKGLINYLRGQVLTGLPADIDKLGQEYLKYLEELQASIVKLIKNGEAIAPEILSQKDKLNLLSFNAQNEVSQQPNIPLKTDEQVQKNAVGKGVLADEITPTKESFTKHITGFKSEIKSKIEQSDSSVLSVSGKASLLQETLALIETEQLRLAKDIAKGYGTDVNRVLGQYNRRLRELKEQVEIKSKSLPKTSPAEGLPPINTLNQVLKNKLLGEDDRRESGFASPKLLAGITALGAGGLLAAPLIPKIAAIASPFLPALGLPLGVGALGLAGLAGARASKSILGNTFPALYQNITPASIGNSVANIFKPKTLPAPPPPPWVTPPPSKPIFNSSSDPNRGISAFFSGLKVGRQGADTARDAITNIFRNVRNQIEESVPIVKNFSGLISSLFKGFIAFQGVYILQGVLSKLSIDAFKAYVELDRLKTALNFASGGSAGGAQNLAFVRKTVDDLKIPLKASAEGFTRLAGATRGTALEGKQTKEIFQGLSEASTVLSLSADETQGAFDAVAKAMSQGSVGAEFFDELSLRIPGALNIAARAIGVTTEELDRMRESGQKINAVDFLPSLGKQFHQEFGTAAKGASNNAPSALYGVQSSFTELQQAIGQGISPAAIKGLNALSDILKGIVIVGKELFNIIAALSVALTVKMGKALVTVISELILTKTAGTTLGAVFSELASTINNSFSAQLTVGVFALLEAINLVNSAVNTELVTSFRDAADAAKEAAKESSKAFDKPKPESSSGVNRFLDQFVIEPFNSHFGTKFKTYGQQEQDQKILGETQALPPVASSGFGRFYDDNIAPVLNHDNYRDSALKLGITPQKGGNAFANATFGNYEQGQIDESVANTIGSNADLSIDASKAIKQLQTRTGPIGQLPGIDKELRQAQDARKILAAQIKRDYTDKGLAIPAEAKRNQDAQNIKVQELTDKRADIAKPYTTKMTETEMSIGATKAEIERMKSPEAIKAAGGVKAAMQIVDGLNYSLKNLQDRFAGLQSAQAALRVDPVRAFTQSLRELNLVLAEGLEKNKDNLQGRKLVNSREAIAGFSTNKLAGKQLAFKNADDEYKAAQIDEANSSTAVKAYEDAANKPDFQATLQRLGLTPDASVSKIDDILKNSTDEADKGILEKLKAGREAKAKYKETQQATVDAREKRRQVVQDNSLFKIDDGAADARAASQKAENTKIAAVKNAQTARLITEEVAAEKISRIQLGSTKSQQKNLSDQLALLRTYYNQGAISAEQFALKRRDLETQQTELEKQQAENRLAVQSATLQRRIKEVEIANKQAESQIAISQTSSSTGVKERLLTSGITISGKDSADLEQNKIDQKAAISHAALIKERIAQNQQYYKEGLQNARETKTQEMALNLELAQNYQQTIDLKIAAEEKYRAIVERNISTRRTIANTAIDKKFLASGLTPEATDQAAVDKNKADQKALVEQIAFIKSRVKNEKQAKDELAALDSELTKLKIEGEEKYRQSVEHNIQRIMQAEENRFKKQTYQLDESKAKLDLYNQSLERTNRLEESGHNLSKATSDAKISGLEDKKADADDAEGLVQKLKDPSTSPREKADIKNRLKEMGYGPKYGVTVTPATVTQASSGDSPEDYELQIKESKYSIEQKIADLKQKSMQEEQAFQKKSLEYDLKRLKIAAQTALYDAQGEQLSALKAKAQAEGDLKIAIAKKDPTAIATAQTDLEIADKRIKLSDQRLESAQENFNSQDETAANATQAQGVTQGAETQHFGAEEARRRNAASLDLYETGEKAKKPRSLETETWEDTVKRIGGPPSTNYATDLNLQLKPGESIFDAYQRQRDEMKLPTKGVKLPGNSNVNIPPMDKTAQEVRATAIQPKEASGYSEFVMALKMANQGIEQRLDKLIDSMAVVASSPRSIHVSTPNPIDDTATLLQNMQKGQMMAAGV